MVKTMTCHYCGWEGKTPDLVCPVCLKGGFEKEVLMNNLNPIVCPHCFETIELKEEGGRVNVIVPEPPPKGEASRRVRNEN